MAAGQTLRPCVHPHPFCAVLHAAVAAAAIAVTTAAVGGRKRLWLHAKHLLRAA
jgi:hypothetical protein